MSDTNDTTRSGIYQIRNAANGKSYIGSAINIRKRWREHRKALLKQSHHSSTLQRAWDKYGADAFVFEILRFVTRKENLIRVEQHYLDRFRSADKKIGYNISPTAGSCLGVVRTPETKAKLSAANKGKKHSPESRAKMSAARKGFALSPEHVAKLSAANKGKKASPETRAKLSEIHKLRLGNPEERAKLSGIAKRQWQNPDYQAKALAGAARREVSEETREKSRKNAIKMCENRTEEWRANVVKALIKRNKTPEMRAMTAERNRNASPRQPISDETRAKLSKAQKGRKRSKESIAKREATRRANCLSSQNERKAFHENPCGVHDAIRPSELGPEI